MAHQKLDGVTIERAEKFIRVLFEMGTWPDSALTHMDIDRAAFSNYMKHSAERIRAMYQDIDPRHEAAIMTMLTHMFLTGVAAGRGTGYSEDQGLNP